MGKRTGQKIKLATIDELLGVPSVEGCEDIEVTDIHPFRGYPFKVKDDDKMHELVESIMMNGVLAPVTVRPLENGGYEMISGHRRLFAVKQIGMEKIPAIVKEYSDDEAVMAMVDSNLQREEILPSEKAFAYKMRYEVLRHQKEKIPTTPNSGRKTWADEELADLVGESKNQVHRFLRLTEVIPPILDLVDRKALAIVTAVEVSYLSPKVQQMLYEYMMDNEICMAFQLYALRDYMKEHETITRMELIRIMNENAHIDVGNRFQKITITTTQLKEYFPVFYTKSQIEKVVFGLLEEWKRNNKE